jgi:hypothetical protein
MVLKLPVRPLTVPQLNKSSGFKPMVAVAKIMAADPTPPADKTPPKSITVRMPANHTLMLEEVMGIIEADKSETIKRAIRLMHSVMTGHNVEMVMVDKDGRKTVTQIIKNGVPY